MAHAGEDALWPSGHHEQGVILMGFEWFLTDLTGSWHVSSRSEPFTGVYDAAGWRLQSHQDLEPLRGHLRGHGLRVARRRRGSKVSWLAMKWWRGRSIKHREYFHLAKGLLERLSGCDLRSGLGLQHRPGTCRGRKVLGQGLSLLLEAVLGRGGAAVTRFKGPR